MGYRGKLRERDEARRLRLAGRTMNEIAQSLCVSKSSVSRWVRDVEFTPRPSGENGNRGARVRAPNVLQRRKQAEIDRMNAEGVIRIDTLSDHAFLAAGTALYAGEGGKTDGTVIFANSDPEMIRFFMRWLRRFFVVEESRLRVHLYLHKGLDLNAAVTFWSELTGIPATQFTKPYRAIADAGIRHSKHVMGCPRIVFACARTHRGIMGPVRGLLSSGAIPG